MVRDSQLDALGWRPWFQQQIQAGETDPLLPFRVGAHFGSQILLLGKSGELTLPTALTADCGPLAVGDWILLEPETMRGVRCLDRHSLISRKSPGEKVASQLIAANVDTLFIVSSCNHDFNPSRLERYLALASEAQVHPVVVLTKSDLTPEFESLREATVRLAKDLAVIALDARQPQQTGPLTQWCGVGCTVALVGSSGVGKSTLAMALGASNIATQGIREDDSKGRHTTTTRSIHRLGNGGLLIDTPGMRELQLADCEEGVDEVFDEIVALAEECRFRDCSHKSEPGCAVVAAVERGELDARRLRSYQKLQSEQARNAQSLYERRDQSRKLGQYYKSVQASKRRRREMD